MKTIQLKNQGLAEAQYAKTLQEYLAKKDTIRRSELDKMKEAFRQFFASDPDFSVMENNGKVIAETGASRIELCEDYWSNQQDESLGVHMVLVIGNRQYKVKTLAHSNRELDSLRPIDEKIKERDLRYYQAYCSGEILYTFTYQDSDTRKEFATFLEYLDWIG